MDKELTSKKQDPANEQEISSLPLTSINDNRVATVKQIINNQYSLFVFLRHFAWLPWRQHVKQIEEQKVFWISGSNLTHITFLKNFVLLGSICFSKLQHPHSLFWVFCWSFKVAKRNQLPFPNMDGFRPSFLSGAELQTFPFSGT